MQTFLLLKFYICLWDFIILNWHSLIKSSWTDSFNLAIPLPPFTWAPTYSNIKKCEERLVCALHLKHSCSWGNTHLFHVSQDPCIGHNKYPDNLWQLLYSEYVQLPFATSPFPFSFLPLQQISEWWENGRLTLQPKQFCDSERSAYDFSLLPSSSAIPLVEPYSQYFASFGANKKCLIRDSEPNATK